VTEADPKLRLALVDAQEWTSAATGTHCRRECWKIAGGEIDPTWCPAHPRPEGWEPSSRFTLYVVDGVVDVRLASFGGVVWPTAWTHLFQARRGAAHGRSAVEITDLGLQLRSAALDGASATFGDTRAL
jgi:hypothetical protein